MSYGSVCLWKSVREAGVLKATVLIALILLAGMAQAVTCTTTSSSLPIKFPASVSIPRDAVAGTLLTPWTDSSSVFYNCQGTDPSKWTGVGGWSVMEKDGITSVVAEGFDYAVFSTGLKGVGMIARFFTTGGVYAPTPVSPKKKMMISGRGGTAYPILGMSVSLALVKTGNIVAGKVDAGIFGRVGAGEANSASNAPGDDDYLLKSLVNVTYSDVNVQMGTCGVPNVVVDLGTHNTTELTTSFSTTKPKDFNVAFKDCPGSIKKISMSLSRAEGSVFRDTSGVFEVSDDSTARGVAIKVMEANGTAITFDKFYPLVGYDGTGGSANFPLKAAIMKVGTVSGGKVNGSLRFNILYQ